MRLRLALNYNTTEYEYRGEPFQVEMLTGMVLLTPEQGGPGIMFINKDNVPTHVAFWTPDVARKIMASLNVFLQNQPI